MFEENILRELIITIIALMIDIICEKIINDYKYSLLSLLILVVGRYFSGNDFPNIPDSSLGLVVLTIYKSISISIYTVSSRDAFSFLAGIVVILSFIIYYLDPNIEFLKYLIDITLFKKSIINKKKKKEKVDEYIL